MEKPRQQFEAGRRAFFAALRAEAAVSEKIGDLRNTIGRLEERIANLEDLCELNGAVAENGDRPLIPWEHAHALLD